MKSVKNWIRDHPYWTAIMTFFVGMVISPPLIMIGASIERSLGDDELSRFMRKYNDIDRHRCEFIIKQGLPRIAESEKPLTDFQKQMRYKRRVERLVEKAICQSNPHIEGVRHELGIPTNNDSAPVSASLVLRNLDQSDTSAIENSVSLTTIMVDELEKNHLTVTNKQGMLLHD